MLNGVKMALPDNLGIASDYVHYGLWILLPVAGWAAESWMGRYRAVVTGLVMCALIIIIVQFAFIMLEFDWTPIPSFVLLIFSLIIGTFGFGCFHTIMLPFTLDQMIGASAEELSTAVQWYYWGYSIGLLIRDVLKCIPIPQFIDILPVVYLALGSLSFSAALIMDCLCHKQLDTHDKTGNPIKLIYQVLNYARKNKCPRLRSALTYIDEEHPSRIDFGKHKFGGPFTEEEVEDVKTVFRLAPLLISAFGLFLSLEFYDQFHLHIIPTTARTFLCVQHLKVIVFNGTPIILIPIYRLILYPFIHNCVQGISKITGTGLFICLVTTVLQLQILSIGHFYSNASHCIFNDFTESGTINVSLHWVLIIDLVNGVGVVLVMCSLFELIVAQTPNRMRGIMMGLLITVIGIGVFANALVTKTFQQFQTASPSCVFYYYLVLSLLLLLILTVFVILAKRYKLREREKHINIQAIVEEHYERYFDQEEQYMREAAQNMMTM